MFLAKAALRRSRTNSHQLPPALGKCAVKRLESIGRNESEVAISIYITSFTKPLYFETSSQSLRTGRVIDRRTRRRCGLFGAPGRIGATLRQGYPGYSNIAVQKGLTCHPIALTKILFGQVLAFFWLDRIGVLQPAFDPAATGAAQTAAAFERNAALFAQRYAQQIAVFRCFNRLAAIRNEGDLDHCGLGRSITQRRR